MSMRDGITYLLARGLPACVNLGTIAVLSRLLTSVEYGRYSLIITAAGVLNVFFFSWSAQAVFRYFAASRSDVSKVISTGLAGYAISLLLASGCAIVLAVVPSPNVDGTVVVATLALLAMLAWLDLTGIMINLEGKAGKYAGLHLARATAAMIAGSAAAYLTGLAGFVVVAMALAYASIVVLKPFRSWLGQASRKAIDKGLLSSFSRYGIPLAMSILLMQIALSADRFVLLLYAGAAAVGGYAVGSDLAQFAIGAVAGAISLTHYPKLVATLEEKGEASARRQLTDYSVLLLAVILPTAVGLAAVSGNLLTVMVGENLRQTATRVMPWTCVAALFAFMKTGLLDYAYQLGKWPVGSVLIAALTVAANIVANLLLIPHLGSIGAAVASAGSMAIGVVACVMVGRWRKLAYLPVPSVDHLKVVLATLGMLTVLWRLPAGRGSLWLMAQVAVGAISYALFCYFLDIRGVKTRRWWRAARW